MLSTKKKRVIVTMGVAAGIVLAVVNTPFLQWLSGRTNCTVSGLQIWIALLTLWLLIVVFLVSCLSKSDTTERYREALLAAILIAMMPWGLRLFHFDVHGAFATGFSEWAAVNPVFKAHEWMLAVKRDGEASPVPPWWPIDERTDMLVGVPIRSQDLPDVAEGLDADEIRYVENGVIFAWMRGQAGWIRFVFVCWDDCQPPDELDSPILVWKNVKPGMWVAIEIGH